MTYILLFLTIAISIPCFSNRALFDKLSLVPFRVIHNREWYRVITHAFVHADYIHLAVNMFVLWSFGQYLEELFRAYERSGVIFSGRIDYLLLYIGGIAASSVYDLIKRKNDPGYSSIGASGAVSAVVFASIFFNPWNELLLLGIVPIPGILFGVLYILYSQYMGRRGGDNVNHNAHLYGALYGFVFPILTEPSWAGVFLRKLTEF